VTSSRLAYIVLRAREAGARGTLRKISQMVRPHLYRPLYQFRRAGRTKAESSALPLAQMGRMIREAFATVAIDPARRERIRARSASLESGNITVLGFGETAKPTGKHWRRDVFHDHDWPLVYFPSCDFLASGIRCDVKIPWEMSRLQWLPWLAEAALLDDGADALGLRDQIFSTLDDWTRENPPGFGVNWTCGMEVAIRAVNIIFASAPFVGEVDGATRENLMALLRAHLDYLRRFPEVSDVPGNHYLTDLMGEVVLLFALEGAASRHTRAAFRAFAEEADRQFDDGGCHIEYSTIYHRLTVDVVALVFALALRVADDSAESLGRVMARADAFCAQIVFWKDIGRYLLLLALFPLLLLFRRQTA